MERGCGPVRVNGFLQAWLRDARLVTQVLAVYYQAARSDTTREQRNFSSRRYCVMRTTKRGRTYEKYAEAAMVHS